LLKTLFMLVEVVLTMEYLDMILIMMSFTMLLILQHHFYIHLILKNQLLLPPIDLGLSAVETIEYDSQLKRLLIYGPLPNKQMALMSYSTTGGPAGILTIINQYKSLASTVVDSPNQLLYVIGTNNTQWNYGTIDLNNPTQLVSSFNLQCNFTQQFSFEINCLYYDSDDKKLYAVGVTNPLAYWLVDIPIDQKGACTAYPMKPDEFGIATAFTYDQITKTMWFGYAVNGPSRLVSYDVKNKKISNDFVFSDQVVLEDLQVTYF